jgi:hemerythrin-like domain-containing protein
MNRALAFAVCLLGGCHAKVPITTLGAESAPANYWCAARGGPDYQPSPIEYLMREHGVYERVLLIYEEAARRLDRGLELPDDVVPGTARMTQSYLEAYHQDLEEKWVFPRFEKAIVLTPLVRELRADHENARAITADILMLTSAPPRDGVERARVAERLRRYIKLMRPHLAREDTALLPGLPELVTPDESKAMVQLFETREKQLFGGKGFNEAVANLETLEKKLTASRTVSE